MNIFLIEISKVWSLYFNRDSCEKKDVFFVDKYVQRYAHFVHIFESLLLCGHCMCCVN